jgi:hypothetical protein
VVLAALLCVVQWWGQLSEYCIKSFLLIHLSFPCSELTRFPFGYHSLFSLLLYIQLCPFLSICMPTLFHPSLLANQLFHPTVNWSDLSYITPLYNPFWHFFLIHWCWRMKTIILLWNVKNHSSSDVASHPSQNTEITSYTGVKILRLVQNHVCWILSKNSYEMIKLQVTDLKD